MAVAFQQRPTAPVGAARAKERRGATAPLVKGKRMSEHSAVSVQLGGRWASLLQAEECCRATELEQHAELQVAAQALAAEQARSAAFSERLLLAQHDKSAAEDDNAKLRCRVAQMAGQVDGFIVCIALLQAELQAAERAVKERAVAYEDQQTVYTGVCSALIDADARYATLAAEKKSVQEALKASERTCSSMNKRVAEADLRARRALQAQRETETRLGIVMHEKERIAGLLQKKDKLARDLAHVAKRALSEGGADVGCSATTSAPPPPPRHAATTVRVCTSAAAGKGRADAPEHKRTRNAACTHPAQAKSRTPDDLAQCPDDAAAIQCAESEAQGVACLAEAGAKADAQSSPAGDVRNIGGFEAGPAVNGSSLSTSAETHAQTPHAQTQVNTQAATHASTRACPDTIATSDADAGDEAWVGADTLGSSASALIARHSSLLPPSQPVTTHCASTGPAQRLPRTRSASSTSGTLGTSGTSRTAWLRGVPVPDQLRAENAVLHGVIRDRDWAMAQMQEEMHKMQREHAAMLVRWRGCMQKGRGAS